MKKALLINHSGIGDIVSSLVVANELLSSYEVTFFIQKSFKGLLENTKFKEAIELNELNEEFDLLIDLTSNKETRNFTKKIKAKEKVGRYKKLLNLIRFRSIYTIQVPKFPKTDHIVRDYAPILKKLNLTEINETKLELNQPYEKQEIVSIHIGADKKIRRIPPQTIIDVIKFLQEKNIPVRIIGIEQEEIDEILSKTDNYPIFEKGNLSDVKRWLAQSKLILASDSGLYHLGSSLSIPTIGVFGPNTSKRCGSINSNTINIELDYSCRPCNQNISCPYNNKCMQDISVGTITKHISNTIFNF